MPTYSITSRTSGYHIGTYDADSREAALDAMSREAGYANHAEACEVTGDVDLDGSDLIVTEIVEITPDA